MKQYLVFQQIIFGLLIFLHIFEIDGATVVSDGKKSKLNIGIIGAGYNKMNFYFLIMC